MKCDQDLCLNLCYDLNKLLWQDGLNPRVRCAFGNVFSDEVVSPNGYFPLKNQDPSLERGEAQSLKGDKWSLLGNCGVSCPERKLFYQQMPEIGQWTLTV